MGMPLARQGTTTLPGARGSGRHRPHPCCHGYRLGLNGPLSTCPGQLGLLLLEKLELEVLVGLKISDPGTRNLAAIPGNVGEGGAAQSSEAR